MYQLPNNLYPWLIGSVALLFFGFRGLANYRRLHNPLSLLFAVSGFLIGGAFFFWSVPFFFVNTNTAMIIVSLIGDLLYYIMLALQSYIVFYLTLKSKISAAFMVVPAVVIAIIGWTSHLYGYLKYGLSVDSGSFEYTIPLAASIAQILLIVNVFLIGIIMLTKIKEQSNMRARLGLIGIAVLYLLFATAGTLNILLSGEPNQSPIIIISYFGGFALFAGVLLSARFWRSSNDHGSK